MNRFVLVVSILTIFAVLSPASTVYTNSGNIAIPSAGTVGSAGPYPSTISVTGLGLLTNLTVTLINMTHTFPDDIDILLVGPTGLTLLLMSDVGGDPNISNVTLTFSDAAGSNLPDTTQIVSGTFRPTNIGGGDTFAGPAPGGVYGTTLSVFNGSNPNGTWSLYVVDDLTGNVGSIAGGWSLTITETPEPSTSLLIGAGLVGLGTLSRRRRTR